LLMCYNLSA